MEVFNLPVQRTVIINRHSNRVFLMDVDIIERYKIMNNSQINNFDILKNESLAKADDIDGKFNIGLLHLVGDGKRHKKNVEKACKIFIKCARQGKEDAKNMLMYLTDDEINVLPDDMMREVLINSNIKNKKLLFCKLENYANKKLLPQLVEFNSWLPSDLVNIICEYL